MREKKIHSASDFWCIESKFFVMYSSLNLEGVWGGGMVVGKYLDRRRLIYGPRWGDKLSHSRKKAAGLRALLLALPLE